MKYSNSKKSLGNKILKEWKVKTKTNDFACTNTFKTQTKLTKSLGILNLSLFKPCLSKQIMS